MPITQLSVISYQLSVISSATLSVMSFAHQQEQRTRQEEPGVLRTLTKVASAFWLLVRVCVAESLTADC
jgi:hypothetical protein